MMHTRPQPKSMGVIMAGKRHRRLDAMTQVSDIATWQLFGPTGHLMNRFTPLLRSIVF